MSADPKNPYGRAADAYITTAAATDQRSLEGKILLKAAQKLESLADRLEKGERVSLEEIGSAFEYNRKLWMVFVNETMNEDHPLPQTIKNNIANLGIFVFKRSNEALIETTPQKIRPLVEINRSIAAGLMKQAENARQAEKPPAEAQSSQKKQSTDSFV